MNFSFLPDYWAYFNYGVFEKDYLFPDYGRINEEEYIENSRSPAYKKLREKLLEK